eukprot:1182378-Prorocentrum_minimum.AAC.3
MIGSQEGYGAMEPHTLELSVGHVNMGKELYEIANHLATGNTLFASNAAVELGQMALKPVRRLIINCPHATEIAISRGFLARFACA